MNNLITENEIIQNDTKSDGRNPSLDVLRIFAFFTVVCFHFFACSQFNKLVTGGKMMLVGNIIKTLASVCVPLYMMLSGYLTSKKTISRKYYRGLGRIIGTYVICSILNLVYKMIYYDYSFSILGWAKRILNFTACDYAWYMEMYFGLFLLIPFLNLMYNGLKGRKEKLILVASLLFLTALPGVLNTFNFSDASWWLEPSSSTAYTQIIPQWWTGIYPITLYVIGAYLKEYPIKMKWWVNLLLLALSTFIFGVYNYYRLRGSEFFWGAFLTNSSLFVCIEAVLVFELFANLDMRSCPKWLADVLKYVSGLTLASYLLSPIFDAHFYRGLKESVPIIEDRMKYAPLMVLCVFFSAIFASGIEEFVREHIARIVSFCHKKMGKNHFSDVG